MHSNPKKILLIEDNLADVRLISEFLQETEKNNFKLLYAKNLSDGLKSISSNYLDIILLDLLLPDSRGLDTVTKIIEKANGIPIIVLTGLNDKEMAIKSLSVGVQDYLFKDQFNTPDLLIRSITYAIERKSVENKLKENETKLEQSYDRLQKILDGIMSTLATVVETKDLYTAGHQKRVAKLSISIAQELALDNEKVNTISTAALIHDIGKIGVPASILAKPTRLTDIEFAMIKTHSQIGYDILKEIDFGYPIAEIILQHHERLDGSGYPKGLKDKDIMLEAKIIGVADTVEAMATHRPYRASLGINKAFKELAEGKDIFYDNNIVDACIRVFNNKNFKF
ncbi:MAG: HD domain-containing protein [Actinobacteria bacterium]|nr:HD domain-containing protein [Actinomycetota bacterium]